MARRRTATELERAAAARDGVPPAPGARGGEALAMLLRRGLDPRPTDADVPFPPDLDEARAERIARRLGHYAFRLFLRGAILAGGPFRPASATRYLSAAQALGMAQELVALGLGEPAGRGRYRLRWPPHTFGGTLEWWVGRELRRLGFDVATGVRSGARGVGGDLDVIAAAEGKLVYLELKSSPPKHIARAEVAAFLRRVHALRPDLMVFAVDTALRLYDKVVPMITSELLCQGASRAAPRRLSRENWVLAPRLYAVNARQDLIDNIRRAIADGLLSLSPAPP